VGTVAAAIVALGLTAGRLPVALLACAVFGWAFVAATSALIAWTTRVVPDRAAAGTSTLFITLVVGQAAGSSVAGVVAERRGLSSAFVLAAAVALLAAVSGRHQAPSARDSSGHFPAVQP
jgi:predicted MFS family arabinose efflux permease